MSNPVSIRQMSFRDAALSSTLVTEEELREAVADLVRLSGGRKLPEDLTDKEVAAQLAERGVVTAYQADQLLAGRFKLTLGPYIITEWIGQGGMGQVFKAVHTMLGRECALKVLPVAKSTPDAIANFRREIRTQARLDHYNLVRAYDAGVDGKAHYLAVEYVPGTDLRRLVRSKGRLSVQQAANIIKQTAEGLSHAHQHGLIHRDIKPGNILVTPEGIAKLSDLGLAGYINDVDDPRAGKIVGTADYLSPEQIRSPRDVTKATDIYSLGCTLYYAVTGKVPYPGGSHRNKAQRHLEETPWHPRRFNDEVSDEFVDLIGDMMEKDPSQRIQSAEEVAERLAPWASDASPLAADQLRRTRWAAAPVPAESDDQETDPGEELAAMAMSDASGDTMQSSQTHSSSGSLALPAAPPVANSIVERFSAAAHLTTDEPMYSLTTLVVTALCCLAAGLALGFIAGRFL